MLFGKGVYALTRPGEVPAKVTDFTATASTESACRAIDALDGALGLASPGTARLLVIVSDAMFVAPGEPAGVQQRITRLHRAGCGVIILTPGATPPPASTPTARSPRPPTPPTPSTPSPAPPPAPSPPDTRPGGGPPGPPPPPRKELTAMTSTAATRISHDQQPGKSDMDEHQRKEHLRTAYRAADQERRAVNEAAHRPSPEDLAAACERARDAALAALAEAGLDGDEALALAERAARQQDDESEVPAPTRSTTRAGTPPR